MIEIKNISKIFKKNKGIFNVSFSIKDGDLTGLIGDNGAGKTTLIKSIMGDYKLDEGEIIFFEKNKNFRLLIGYFPDQNNFPKSEKIYDYCEYILDLKKIKIKDIKTKFENLVSMLGLEEYINNTFEKLSSGMQKRALLIPLLLTEPRLIILDEPTENLDVNSRLEFLKLIKYLAIEFKIMILITSHNINELEDYINKIIFLKNGKICYENNFDKSKESLIDLYHKHLGAENENMVFDKLKEIKK
ncbi:ATP-binding cassette domain-containing protein [Spiroplasma cantharicola]|uniref:Zinc ABC transporter ATP-binding protein n=1 Tax=Spiroplasma cantharicola TaxID=362837 RepID=A0A0M4JWK2_9MOLU|nr:ABC transporter ATP-binding protein [Spiroplasma cantharicola]ALD66342.1 zinc ABC transporter ATP-binding protein [Spiroplasma cantharicola]